MGAESELTGDVGNRFSGGRTQRDELVGYNRKGKSAIL